MRAKIEVTAEDIRLGKRGECGSCPVARATKRALTAASGLATLSVAAFPSTIEVSDVRDPDEDFMGLGWFDPPLKASKFIWNFDAGKPVKPFSFYLNV